jgi:RHS repeat-associated protein
MMLSAVCTVNEVRLDRSLYTGKERDAESGLDYFGARYYSSSMGRFASPDPTGLYFADPMNPQS